MFGWKGCAGLLSAAELWLSGSGFLAACLDHGARRDEVVLVSWRSKADMELWIYSHCWN
jgi:hypothetical protein